MERNRFIRTSLIGLSFMLCLGSPGYAKTKDAGCDGGSITAHRKPDDLVSFVGFIAYKIHGHHNNCVVIAKKSAPKQFVAPTPEPTKTEVREVVTSEAPDLSEFAVKTDDSQTSLLTDAIPEGQTSTIASNTVTNVAAPTTTAKSVVTTTHKGRYTLTLSVTKDRAAANGIVAGTFPALLLENQKPGGAYGKKTRLVAAVTESENGFVNRIAFEKMPVKNSVVMIDLENGHAVPVTLTSELLATVAPSETPSAKLGKKSYADLDSSIPVRQSLAVKTLRVLLPLAPGIATMNPVLLGFGSISIATRMVSGKLGENDRALAALQHPSLQIDRELGEQNDRMDSLQGQIILLKQQIEIMRQKLSTNPQPIGGTK